MSSSVSASVSSSQTLSQDFAIPNIQTTDIPGLEDILTSESKFFFTEFILDDYHILSIGFNWTLIQLF